MQQNIHSEGVSHHSQPPGLVPPPLQVLPIGDHNQFFRGQVITPVVSGATVPTAHVTTAPKSEQPNRPFHWTKVDGIKVPYFMRGNVKFVSVKMVESKLLSRFPKITMDNMGNVGPIYSYYVTEAEAKLLTEINAQCYSYAFGNKAFTTKDLIVSLGDFENFYNRARQHFLMKSSPKESKQPSVQSVEPTPHRTDGGWVQINNTVVPYVLRKGVKFVPLSVIKYAAGLLTDIRMDGYRVASMEAEYNYLNTSCQAAGVNFTFSVKTKLIKLELVIRMSHSKVVIQELPSHDPFNHAQYSEGTNGQRAAVGGQPTSTPPPDAILPMKTQQQMPPRNPFVHQLIPGQQPFTSRAPVPFSNTPVLPVAPPPRVNSRPQVPFIPRDQQTPSPSISPRVTPASMTNKSESVSSATSSRPSSVQSRSSVTPPLSPKATIKSLQFEGKTVSCLMRDGEKDPFALLEALVRLYFPHCSLSDFQSALEQVLNIPVYQLTNEEEAEFIKFYGLRVKSLRCKSIVSFDEFQSNHVQLKCIFSSSDSPKPVVEPPHPNKGTDGVAKEGEKVENNNNNSSHGEDENKANSTHGAQKRKAGVVSHKKKAKQLCKRLEDTVAMLKMRKETPTEEDGETE